MLKAVDFLIDTKLVFWTNQTYFWLIIGPIEFISNLG
jgi:hypothetical protein